MALKPTVEPNLNLRKNGGRSEMLDEPSREIPYLSIFITHFFGTPAENPSILRKLYLDFDLPASQISQITGFSRTSISDFFRANKIKKEIVKSNIAKYGERILSGGVRVPHNAELHTIQKILALRKEGESYRDIARKLNEQGIKTKQGRAWSKTTVQAIINRNQEG